MLSVFFACLFYVATGILLVGVSAKVGQYLLTPAPLKIATTPAPTTSFGVFLRMMREVLLFESLFKSCRWTWIFGYFFHFALALVIIRHLRYFTEPIWWWVALIQPFGKYASFLMLFGLAGLLARRVLVDRVRYISAPSDYLMLILFLGITLSGILMTFVENVDVISLKMFFLGLMYFDWQPIPSHPLLIVHLLLVAVLMIVFPFSKLLHAPGLFFSPTRTMVDNPRETRYKPRWKKDHVHG
tara:strand:+ start:1356 stop:2081 length:726 start_codon:yes stop_codon:yes gene_type:complete